MGSYIFSLVVAILGRLFGHLLCKAVDQLMERFKTKK